MDADDPPTGVEAGPEAATRAIALSLDTALELLANRRRRCTIYALSDLSAGMISFDDLVREVASMEVDVAPGPDEGPEPERVASDLHHWHLPILDETGVVVYDERSDIVQYVGDALLETWAPRLREEEFGDGR